MAIAMDETMSVSETNDVLLDLASSHAQKIACATTRECLLRYLNSSDFPALCDFSVDYANASPSDALEIRQILAFFQKRKDLDLGLDKEAVAWSTFEGSESACYRTNSRFLDLSRGRDTFPPRVHTVFHGAARKIARVLGPVPSMEQLRFRFGPGATTTVNKKNASTKRKLSEGCQCSEGLVPLLGEILEEVPAWCELLNRSSPDSETYIVDVDVVHAKMSFVPKNAKTYRGIVVEPVLNSFVQLGIGDYIASRLLRRAGIDIRDQTANQRAARAGSLLGTLATLDLSSASDTISTELVYHLLPLDWALLLDSCRSDKIEYQGRIIGLQKFSSMGNGFTFPLETLIFWALMSSACDDDPQVLAYGDDLVVPSKYADLCCEVLSEAGFTVNPLKSFVSGPFRESCGRDYLMGIDIRPLYVKDSLTYWDLFRLHNFYVREFRNEFADRVLLQIPSPLRIWGPDGYGDGHLVGDHPILRHNLHRGWAGYTFDTYVSKPRTDLVRRPGDCVLPAYSIYMRNPEIRGFTRHSKADSPACSLPGKKGYRRISIYTLG